MSAHKTKKRTPSNVFDIGSKQSAAEQTTTNTEHVITEKELLRMVKRANDEYKNGKTIKANSLAELL